MVGVGDLDLGVDLGLLDLDCRVHQGDVSIVERTWHSGVNSLFVENDPVDECTVTNRATLFLLDLDVGQVDQALAIFNLADRVNRPNADVGEEILDCSGTLSGQGGLGDLGQCLIVVSAECVLFEKADSLLGGETESFTYHRRVNILLDQILGPLE